MITGLQINVDGTTETFTAEGDGLRALQKAVDGWVEVQNLEHAQIALWFNEDGKNHNLPFNRAATYAWWQLAPEFEMLDHLVGTVVITGFDGAKMTDLTEERYKLFEKFCADVTAHLGSSGTG